MQDLDKQTPGSPNLIELAISIPNTTSSNVPDSSLRTANLNSLENRVDIIGANPAGASLNPCAAEFQPHTSSEDMPPILDLQFKGLRTDLDGPERSAARINSSGSHDSGQTLSLDEIYGRVFVTSQDKSTICSEIGQLTNSVTSSANHDAKVRENVVSNVNTTNLNLSPTSSYDFIRQSRPSSFESSSAQSSDSFRMPLSLSRGIRFQPKEGDFSTRTRVMVLNLPKDILVATVLSKIRGGKVVSCEILDTNFAYGSPSAMVRFSTHSEAMVCAATAPLVFGDRTALVQLVPTPTYPLAPEVYQNIFEHGHTRCFRVGEFHRIKDNHIFRKYSNPQYIEYQGTNSCGDWFVRFTSLTRASALWADLQYFRIANFDGGFMPDPCDIEDSLDLATWTKNVRVMEGGMPDWKV